jgi:hypothetical protein
VIGFENKGKTWIINKLIDIYLESGLDVHTEGISLKYSIDPSRNIAFID